jgi:hypothetical protein
MRQQSIEEQILQRLNLLVLLQLDSESGTGSTTVTSKIQKLLGLGFSPAEVASILRKPVNYVTAVTSSARRTPTRKGGHRG